MSQQYTYESIANSATQPSDDGRRYDSSPVHNPSRSSIHAESSKPNPSSRLLAPDLHRGLLMALMAMDHVALSLNTWEHGTSRSNESDGTIVKQWNHRTAYIVRTLTHFCAPGFMFLLGMGVVFLSRSRINLSWSAWRFLRHYTTRTFLLTAVSVLGPFILTRGQLWFANVVLFALAADYLLAGMLWLLMNKTERMLAQELAKVLLAADRHTTTNNDDEDDEDDEDEAVSQPLLQNHRKTARESEMSLLASSISWYIHNAVLLALSLVTIWWNIWFSENNGHCKTETSTTPGTQSLSAAIESQNIFLRIWFWNVNTERMLSDFPPMAWLSFAILGLLYGRIIASGKLKGSVLAASYFSVGLIFAILFTATRIFRFGNLSEDCLHTPNQDKNPEGNPYLNSTAAFFYIIKYPPDVAFWAFTMAGNFSLLAIFSATPIRFAKRFTILLDFGRSSLFFYFFHLFILMSPLADLLRETFGNDTDIPNRMSPDATKGVTNPFGYSAAWVGLLLLMWPACRYYGQFKSTKPVDSLWRFF